MQQAHNLQKNLVVQLIDRAIQGYLKDAMRYVEIKIFQAHIKIKDQKQPLTVYFVGRLELGYRGCAGNGSVYERLESLRHVLNSTNMFDCETAYKEQEKKFPDGTDEIEQEMSTHQQHMGAAGNPKDAKEKGEGRRDTTGKGSGGKQKGHEHSRGCYKDGMHCMVHVTRMDYLGKEYSDDVEMEPLPCHVSYMKLINIPCMFDVGCTQADP